MHNLVKQLTHYLTVRQCSAFCTFGLCIGKTYEMKHLHHMHCTIVTHGLEIITYAPAALETEEVCNTAFGLLGGIVVSTKL